MSGHDRIDGHRCSPVGPCEVDRLVRAGAPADLVEFAERHVIRYSMDDIYRARRVGFWLGVGLTVVLAAVLWALVR